MCRYQTSKLRKWVCVIAIVVISLLIFKNNVECSAPKNIFTSALVQVEVEPVGKWYHFYELARLKSHQNNLLEEEENSEEEEDEDEGEEEHEVEIVDDITYLRSLDPADWKVG